MTAQAVVLRPENAPQRWDFTWAKVCEYLELGKPVMLTVDEFKPRRSLDQNARFHAICADMAAQFPWAGQAIDTEGWKRLLVDAWARVEGKGQGRVVPSIDGQSVVNLGIQTRKMSVADMTDLMAFAEAWATEHGVQLNVCS